MPTLPIRASQTAVNKCATVVNNPISPRAGGAFNPACVFPAPAAQPAPATGNGRCGTFVSRPPVRTGLIDSIPVSRQQVTK